MNEEEIRQIREEQLRLTNEYEESSRLFGNNEEEIDKNIAYTKKSTRRGIFTL